MAVRLVTCKKCKRVFDYESTSGICPKCARFYSSTSYNEEEAYLNNILSSSNEGNCSYHGQDAHSGHSERLHTRDSVNKSYAVNTSNPGNTVNTYKGTTPNLASSTKLTQEQIDNNARNNKVVSFIFTFVIIIVIIASMFE